jgi:hypothetical protein
MLSRHFADLTLSPTSKENVAFEYTAFGGGSVKVLRTIRPYEELGIPQDASRQDIKGAYSKAATHHHRQRRVMGSISYMILVSAHAVPRFQQRATGVYEIARNPDAFVIAAAGDTYRLSAEIKKDRSLLTRTNEHNHTLLYLTARAGFYDTTEALLKMGALVNEKQVDGSTPLHGASFYGQRLIVGLLLRYGADATIKNKWDNMPVNEAATDEIRKAIVDYKNDPISKLISELMSEKLVSRVHLIHHKDKVVGKEIIRNPDTLDLQTKRNWGFITSNWYTVWHGTKSKYLVSILRHGLMPSGTKLSSGHSIEPPSNHFKLGATYFGIRNWANAIFLSPSITYASHACYSDRITAEDGDWCVLIKAYIKPKSYSEHVPTVKNPEWDAMDDEPSAPEFRIKVTEPDKILRLESARNVVVAALVLISNDFLSNLESVSLTELKSLFEVVH